MDPRTTSRPKVKPKPATGRPTGIAGLAAWLGALPLPSVKPRQDRREAWLARREARAGSGDLAAPAQAPAVAAAPVPPPTTTPFQAPGSAIDVPAANLAAIRSARAIGAREAAEIAPRRLARPARKAAAGVPAFAAIPAAPVLEELPDLASLVAAPDAAAEPVPAWVTAEAPRMLFEMPGPGDAVEGQEFFRLFRANADGLQELARLAADDAPAAPLPMTEDRPWWRFAAR